MKPHTALSTDTGRSTNHVRALLVALCILCGALAVLFNRQKNELREQLDRIQRKQSYRPAGTGETGSRDTEQPFTLVNLLAQKDAVINELRQRILALQEGRVPETGLSPNALPKSVRTSRQHKPPERPAVAPPTDAAARYAPPDPTPVFKNLADQVAFLQNTDVNSMTAGEQRNHSELLRHLGTLRRIVGELGRNQGNDPTGELRSTLSREEQAIEELMQQERQTLLRNMGRELGYDDESSLWFAEYIEHVDRMTTFESSSRTDPGPLPMPPEMPTPELDDQSTPPPMPGQ